MAKLTKRTRHQEAEARTQIVNSLTRLGIARREKLAREDYDVFTEGLLGYPVDLVVRTCEEFSREPPGEYEPRFPPLHALRGRLDGLLARRREAEERKRLLPPRLPDERLKQLLADVKAATARHTMK